MGRYVTVNVSTENVISIAPSSWSNIGMVGRGVGAGFTVNTAYTIKNPNEAKTLFGETSALYKSILIAFENGATTIIAVPAAVDAQTQEKFNGNGTLKEFTLSKVPAQPLDEVEIVGVGVQVEDEDFYVDYGNKKIYFYTAPPAGSNNIEVDFSIHNSTYINNALAVLEEKDVQLIVGAMMFDSTLLSAIKTHCVAMAGISHRLGVYMLANGETSVTLATTLQSHLSILIAHKSLKDVASAVIGLIASLEPWKGLTMKEVSGIENAGNFTSSQIAVFDAAYVICMYDPPKYSGTVFVISTGWTLDADRDLGYIDQVRVLHHLASVLENGLNTPEVIGEMRMNRVGLTQLDDYIRSLLNPWLRAGEIDSYQIENPAKTLFELENPDAEDITEMQALQASRKLDGSYIINVSLVYSGSIIYIELNAILTGGV